VIGGMTFRGAHGLGAELGHISVNPDGPACPGNCPNRGCLAAYCSGQALERDATELATDKPDSHLATRLGKDRKVSGREVVAAAQQGDSDSLLLMEKSASTVGLSYRWVIKSVLVFGMFVAFVSGVAVWLQAVIVLFGPPEARFKLMTLEWPEDAERRGGKIATGT